MPSSLPEGVSVGKADFTRTVVEELGELVQWQCRIKPGRPLAIGKSGESYFFFGLPGNPTATQITFLSYCETGSSASC